MPASFWLVPFVQIFSLGLTVVAMSLTAFAKDQPDAKADSLSVYVGTYTKRAGEGINLCRFNLSSGKFSPSRVVAVTKNPTFLALVPNRSLLYAIGEVDDFQDKGTGAVSAFAIDSQSGSLNLLNQQSSGGKGPCHVSIDRSGHCVLVANYGGGSVASFRILDDGQLSPAISIDQHRGSSIDRVRQTQAYGHCIEADPTNRFALSADLGIDKLMIYRLDAKRATIAAHDPAFATVDAGAGPRHLAFHPNGRFVYVVNEMKGTVAVFSNGLSEGKSLEHLQTISTLPANFHGQNSSAEIQIDPTGHFLYASNRGPNNIAAFRIEPATGRLTTLGHVSTHGKSPRHFALVPGGRFLLAANQDSDNVVVFKVDAVSGLLEATGESVHIPAPVCIVMTH